MHSAAWKTCNPAADSLLQRTVIAAAVVVAVVAAAFAAVAVWAWA